MEYKMLENKVHEMELWKPMLAGRTDGWNDRRLICLRADRPKGWKD